ncbi:MAG: hypothetical protein VZS44_11485 [Bacilli bacterium]|nr:hypothetical protein [Bacilli bacterium]
MTTKEIGTILYMYYMNNYCEDEFSFDKGKTFSKVKSYYKKMKEKYGEETIKDIENEIKVREPEGTDYDSMEFYHPNKSDMFFQVTSMYDYDDKPAKKGYTGGDWADVGMFFINYSDCDFDDLSDKD